VVAAGQRFEWVGPVVHTSWEAGPFPVPIEAPGLVEERHEGPVLVQKIGEKTRVIYGPWEVIIRGVGARAEGRVLARWEVRKSWVSDVGFEVVGGALRWRALAPEQGTARLARRVRGPARGRERAALAGGERGAPRRRLRGLQGRGERVPLPRRQRDALRGREREPLPRSQRALARGASERLVRGASERAYAGASERLGRGASERLARGASERLGRGASEGRLGGASEKQARSPYPTKGSTSKKR